MERFIRFLMLIMMIMFSVCNADSAYAEDVVYNFVYPVGPEGNLEGYHISQGFNTSYAEGFWSCDENGSNCVRMYGHDGLDISNYGCDSPIYAAANGTVVYSQWASGWGNLIRIRHLTPDGYRYTQYGHLHNPMVSVGQVVRQGQQIANMGGNRGFEDGFSTSCHLHFGVMTENTNGSGYYYNNMPSHRLDPIEFITTHQSVPPQAQSAIESKANELWGIRPFGGTQCQNGLICEEPVDGNMHWYGGPTATHKSFIIEDWNNGVWGWVALTYDPATNTGNRAYVLRHAFWDAYRNRGGPDRFGAPYGDELDRGVSYYSAYDPYCGTDKNSCIQQFCGPTNVFSSVQRFEHATFCWHPASQQVCLSSDNDASGSGLPWCYEVSPYATQPPHRTLQGGPITPVPEHQYLFTDVNRDGFDDPCLRRNINQILCDTDLDSEPDWTFTIGSGGASWYSTGTGVAAMFQDGLFWIDDNADGTIDRTYQYGTRADAGHYIAGNGGIAIQRYTRYFVVDNNFAGGEEWFYPFGWGLTNQKYYLQDINGDGLNDLSFREGNRFTVETNHLGQDSFYFTYGNGTTDDYYWADLDGDQKSDLIVRRGNTFLVLENTSIPRTCPTCSNSHNWSYTFGNGL